MQKSDLLKAKQGKLKKADPHYFRILCIDEVSWPFSWLRGQDIEIWPKISFQDLLLEGKINRLFSQSLTSRFWSYLRLICNQISQLWISPEVSGRCPKSVFDSLNILNTLVARFYQNFLSLFFHKIGEFLCSLEWKKTEFFNPPPTFVFSPLLMPSTACWTLIGLFLGTPCSTY